MAKKTQTKKTTTDKKYLSDGVGKQELTKSTGSNGRSKTLKDLFHDGLKDILSAEKQLVEALPKVAKAAYSEELRDAFEQHLSQTKKHVERLEKIMSFLKVEAGSKECEAMKGLIKEADEVIKNFPEGSVRDSALIIGAQKVEHYEIASYGSLCELADVLGMDKIHDTLGRTLDEEEDTDALLSDLAVDINDEALEMQSYNAKEEEEPGTSKTTKPKGSLGKGAK